MTLICQFFTFTSSSIHFLILFAVELSRTEKSTNIKTMLKKIIMIRAKIKISWKYNSIGVKVNIYIANASNIYNCAKVYCFFILLFFFILNFFPLSYFNVFFYSWYTASIHPTPQVKELNTFVTPFPFFIIFLFSNRTLPFESLHFIHGVFFNASFVELKRKSDEKSVTHTNRFWCLFYFALLLLQLFFWIVFLRWLLNFHLCFSHNFFLLQTISFHSVVSI